MENPKLTWVADNVAYCRDAQSILAVTTSDTLYDSKRIDPITVGGYRLAPWGHDNLLPNKIMNRIDRTEIVGANADFNWRVCFGNGPKLVRLIRDDEGRTRDYIEISSGREHDWFEENDVTLMVSEMLTDLAYFGNAFPMLYFDDKFSFIEKIRHREAIFSRWGIQKNGQINKHLYCAKWDEMPAQKDIIASDVIDELNAVKDIERFQALRTKRMCYPVYMVSPGRPYYSYPTWYSIFYSGWYDNVTSIPALKKAILKHNLGVKHIIYVSEAYFEAMERQMGVAPDDIKACRELRDSLVKQITDVLMGEDNAGKAIVSLKKAMPMGNSVSIEKYIEIESIKNEISGGEYLTDYETGANIISYAMGVHPSLIGATPGKNSNSLSGSNMREIYLMKQALSKPLTDRAMRVFSLIKKINKWPEDVCICIPEYIFTTLDQNKSGKEESTNNYAV